MMYPLVDELVDEGVPVVRSADVLGFSTQAFYKWRAQPVSERERFDRVLVADIREIHADDPEYGYRFITDELQRRGHQVGEGRVQRLCRQHQVHSVLARKKRSSMRSGPPVHDDLLQRHFHADAIDVAWLTDITEHPTDQGTWYFCAVKDVCSGRIVGYSAGARMTSQLAVNALNHAIDLRQPDSTIVHSDRGGQFRSRAFTAVLADRQLQGSMGRVGACGDNAAMESFFSLLQKNVFNRRSRWETRDQLTTATIDWIERNYHRRRRQRRLGRLTPIEYETVFNNPPPNT